MFCLGCWLIENSKFSAVAILVVVEYVLSLPSHTTLTPVLGVAILVVVEYVLSRNGNIILMTSGQNVAILVVVEYVLSHLKGSESNHILFSGRNPCCRGICSVSIAASAEMAAG